MKNLHILDTKTKEEIDRTLTPVTVEAKQEEQTIVAPEGYNGFNEVKVKAAKLQQKIVTPTKEIQVVKADEGYYGLSDVIVSPPVIDGEDIMEVVTKTNEILSESYIGGNATNNDLLANKEAYSQGKKIQGNIETYTGKTEIDISGIEDYVLPTENMLVKNNIVIKNKQEESKYLYDTMREILLADTEDYEYKVMYVFQPAQMEFYMSQVFIVEEQTSYSTYRLSNTNELITPNSYTVVALGDDTIVEVYNPENDNMTYVKYVIFYSNVVNAYNYNLTGYRQLYNSNQQFFGPSTLGNIIGVIGNKEDEEADLQYIQRVYYGGRHLDLQWPICNLATTLYCNALESNNMNFNDNLRKNEYLYIEKSFQNNSSVDTRIELYSRGKPKTVYLKVIEPKTPLQFSENQVVQVYTDGTGVVFDKKTRAIPYLSTGVINSSISNSQHMNYKSCNNMINFDFNKRAMTNSNFGYIKPNFINFKCFNIIGNLPLGTRDYGYNLTFDSIIHTLGELIKTNNNYTFTIGDFNLPKINDVYVKLLEITEKMYREDEYVYDKFPFVICEPEDEGAMSIHEYIQLKNYSFA